MADRRLTQLMRMDNRGPQNVIRTVNIYAEEGPQQIEILAPATWMGAFPVGDGKIQLHYSGDDDAEKTHILVFVQKEGDISDQLTHRLGSCVVQGVVYHVYLDGR